MHAEMKVQHNALIGRLPKKDEQFVSGLGSLLLYDEVHVTECVSPIEYGYGQKKLESHDVGTFTDDLSLKLIPRIPPNVTPGTNVYLRVGCPASSTAENDFEPGDIFRKRT